jgi:hypothetical protein
MATVKPELAVIGAAKQLAGHVFKITQSAPKQYRFSLSGRMQNMALDIVGLLYSANETFVDMKLLGDMDKSIAALRGKTYASEQERFFSENKLFTLRLTRAQVFENRIHERLDKQYGAMTRLKELDYLMTLSRELGAILPKQQEFAMKLIFDLRNLLGAWIKSDKKRFGLTT